MRGTGSALCRMRPLQPEQAHQVSNIPIQHAKAVSSRQGRKEQAQQSPSPWAPSGSWCPSLCLKEVKAVLDLARQREAVWTRPQAHSTALGLYSTQASLTYQWTDTHSLVVQAKAVLDLARQREAGIVEPPPIMIKGVDQYSPRSKPPPRPSSSPEASPSASSLPSTGVLNQAGWPWVRGSIGPVMGVTCAGPCVCGLCVTDASRKACTCIRLEARA